MYKRFIRVVRGFTNKGCLIILSAAVLAEPIDPVEQFENIFLGQESYLL